MKPLTFGSLFSGIGGMDLGLERAGMVCKWQVEIDPYATRVLEKHWPGVKRYGDIRTVTAADPVDVIAGGFPCQDISLEGSRKGIEAGERSGLWKEFRRIIGLVRPSRVVVENLAALLIPTDTEPAPILRVLGDLASLGFDAEWSLVPACALGGTHVRRRVFIMADTDSKRLERWLKKWKAERVEALPTAAVRRHPTAPRVCVGADGIPNVMERVRGAGNAVYPDVAEWIGRRIIESLEKAS